MKKKFLCGILMASMLGVTVSIPKIQIVFADTQSSDVKLNITYNCPDEIDEGEIVPIVISLDSKVTVDRIALSFKYDSNCFEVMSINAVSDSSISNNGSWDIPGTNGGANTVRVSSDLKQSGACTICKIAMKSKVKQTNGFDKMDFAGTEIMNSNSNKLSYDTNFINTNTGRLVSINNADTVDQLSTMNNKLDNLSDKVDKVSEVSDKIDNLNNKLDEVSNKIQDTAILDYLANISKKLDAMSTQLDNTATKQDVQAVSNNVDNLTSKVDKIDEGKTPTQAEQETPNVTTTTPTNSDNNNTATDTNSINTDNKDQIQNNADPNSDGKTQLEDQNGNKVDVPNSQLTTDVNKTQIQQQAQQNQQATGTPNDSGDNQVQAEQQQQSQDQSNQYIQAYTTTTPPDGTGTPDDGKGPLDDGKGPLDWEGVKTGDYLGTKIMAAVVIALLLFATSIIAFLKSMTLNKKLHLFKKHRVR